MSGAETLRAAAALMRERAEHSAEAWFGPMTWGANFDGSDRLTCLHYQAWKPAVTLAVADWLDWSADQQDKAIPHIAIVGPATAVAEAYLGADQ